MKLKILKSFNDRETRKLMEAGKTAEYEPKRAEELIAKGFAEAAKEPKKKKK